MACAKVAGVLLAAGRGTRFGGNKLEALLDGDMLGLHAARTLASIGCDHLYAVHDPVHARLAAALGVTGFTLLDNHDPAAGLSHSLSLATRAALATEANILLICLADMPRVTTAHLITLIAAYNDNPGSMVASQACGISSPPAIFPRSKWDRLLLRQGDAGARAMLADAIRVDASPQTLADVDTRAILAAIANG